VRLSADGAAGEFRLLAEPDQQPAILDRLSRQLPPDETVIEFTGNTMSDLAIAVIAVAGRARRQPEFAPRHRQQISARLPAACGCRICSLSAPTSDAVACRPDRPIFVIDVVEILFAVLFDVSQQRMRSIRRRWSFSEWPGTPAHETSS